LTSVRTVEIAFGDLRVEIPWKDDITLEAFTVEVQEKLGLHPESFSIHDSFGKVSTSVALRRALDTSPDCACALEVHEDAAWKKIREMDAKIQMLVARCPVADRVMMSIEERSANRFSKLRDVVQDLDVKVNCSMAPMLQTMALQQMEAREKLASPQSSPSFEEVEARITRSLAPLLQTMALQQMDLKAKLDGIHLDAWSSSTEEKMAEGLMDTQKELADLATSYSEKVQEIEQCTKGLRQEMNAKHQDIQDVHAMMKALERKVQSSHEQPAKEGDVHIFPISAMEQDLVKWPRMKNIGGHDGEDTFLWPEGAGKDQDPVFPYSKKTTYAGLKLGGASAVPFARGYAPRQLDRVHGSRSLPLLPPVK
jgi:hypothetical protein